MSCYQVNVSGEGSEVLPKGISFPGAYKNTDPGILVDIYQSNGSYGKHVYIAPGPEVWVAGKAASSKPTEADLKPKPSVPETKREVNVPEPEPKVVKWRAVQGS